MCNSNIDFNFLITNILMVNNFKQSIVEYSN